MLVILLLPCKLNHLVVKDFVLRWLAFYFADTGTRGYGLPAKTSNVKVILNGGQRVTFLRPDGYFSLYPTCLILCQFVYVSVSSVVL